MSTSSTPCWARGATRLLALLIVVTAGACSQGPALPPLDEDARILAFGDSLTYGSGVEPANSYPAQLAERTGLAVINAGVPGELSGEGVERLPDVLDEHQPDLLILCHGGNDLLRQRPEHTVAANLGRMIEIARRRDTPVVLVGVPAPGLWLDTAALYEDVAREYRVPLEADILAELESDDAFKSDRIHLNKKGYDHLAAALHKLLEEAGAMD